MAHPRSHVMHSSPSRLSSSGVWHDFQRARVNDNVGLEQGVRQKHVVLFAVQLPRARFGMLQPRVSISARAPLEEPSQPWPTRFDVRRRAGAVLRTWCSWNLDCGSPNFSDCDACNRRRVRLPPARSLRWAGECCCFESSIDVCMNQCHTRSLAEEKRLPSPWHLV